MSAAAATKVASAKPLVASGPSLEMRRFSAGIRAIVALLCTLLLIVGETGINGAAVTVLLAYDLWACYVIWSEASGRALRRPLLLFWIDVAWTVAILRLTTTGTMMMVVTLVQPVVLTSIGFGVRQGVMLALFAAGGMLLDAGSTYLTKLRVDPTSLVSALSVLALVPLAALLSRPLSVLRQRLDLVRAIEEKLDPRRGLDAMAATLAEALGTGLGADVVALALPSAVSAPAVLRTSEEGAFRISLEMQRRIEGLLKGTPAFPFTHVVQRWWGLRGGTRVHGAGPPTAGLAKRLDELALLCNVRMLVVVPLTRYEYCHGHLLVGMRDPGARLPDVTTLANAAPDLFRLLEQASLVDRLQEESAAHERVRIGRDLHDSAIQPYLGLKYAVEGLACRIAFDDPMRPDVEALIELVNSEVEVLRELISGLRDGEAGGDDALLPAVRRQVRRFSQLFGIDVELQGSSELRTSRALAGELFHMVNEALNNVRKHSPARRVSIDLEQESGGIVLRVRDDAGTLLGRAQPDFHPRSLSERVAALGGTLTISRGADHNSEIVIVVPNGAFDSRRA